MNMARQACLLLTHIVTSELVARYRRLKRELGGMADVWLLVHDEERRGIDVPSDVRVFRFDMKELAGLGCRMFGERLVPGNTHLPLLLFWEQAPEYELLWMTEDDVHFTGDWGGLVGHFTDCGADLVACHVRRFADEPEWFWWPTLHCPESCRDRGSWLRSFNPIFRLSRRAVRCVLDAQQTSWEGHMEALIPTLLHHAGLRIVDMGGDGEFVRPGDTNRFYTDVNHPTGGLRGLGTMRYRPIFRTAGRLPGMLYHPIKAA